jgi:two-component system sensor histidine kinase SenX3
MQDGVLLLGPDGRTAFANDAVRRHLGASPPTVEAILPLPLREAVKEAHDRRVAASVLTEVGSPTRWLRGIITPAGEDGSILMVVRDVTEARRLDAIRRDFVANASHELKSPAASIQAAAETLLQAWNDDPEAVPRFAGQLEREALRLSRIVADLLDLSRLESGSDLTEEAHLDAIVREEAQRLEDPASAAGVSLVVETRGTVPIRGSARDLSLLVRNLVDNAIRYTRPGGEVRIDVSRTGLDGVLQVADTGVGIPTKDRSRIFERFYRVDRARARGTGGTGLGLAIVKHVTENHGGRIEVTSELGRGTTFVITLPLTTQERTSATS